MLFRSSLIPLERRKEKIELKIKNSIENEKKILSSLEKSSNNSPNIKNIKKNDIIRKKNQLNLSPICKISPKKK